MMRHRRVKRGERKVNIFRRRYEVAIFSEREREEKVFTRTSF